MKFRVTRWTLNLRHYQDPALQGSRDLYTKLGLRHPRVRKKKTRDSEARVSEKRYKVSNKSKESRKHESYKSDKSSSTRHTSTVHTMSSSEKRHELDLVKRCHEMLERQYQVSLRLKEQDNCLKFKQSQLELEQLA